MAQTAVAEFEKVSKEYPAGLLRRHVRRAVADVSFRIEAGEVFGLVGPNRAGKTTLVKILLSLCRPTRGRVSRFGRPVADRASLARVGYVHEKPAFPRYLTAAGLLEYYGALALVPYEAVLRRVPQLLELVGLADRAGEPIARFSKGMVQRLGVAQALINDPDLLVLDEPNEGLDLTGRRLVADIVRQQRQRGRTTLLVSHVLPEVEQLCDRLAVLVEGRLVYAGPVAALKHDPRTGTERSLEQALQELYENLPP
ncbi:MAG TPA: ABC transporter ATP-binding protein [Gemmataceae bacterium]|nr:ABC transporter ATP-binding protein [Gemmataceae bacterium]